jgi:hypothetical protein
VHLDDLNYLLLLNRAETLLSMVGHGAVGCVAFIAFNRTKKPVFLLVTLSTFLGFILTVIMAYNENSLIGFGVVFHAWYRVASILDIILGTAGGIWLILYAWRGLGKGPPPVQKEPHVD